MFEWLTLLNNIDPLGEARKYVEPILITLMVLLSVAVIVIILMQKSTSDNIGTMAGSDSDSSIDGKNKTRSKDKTLKKVTLLLGVCLMVVSVVYFIIAAL